MTTITLAQICDAICTTLGTATGVTYTQSYNEITEGMQDTPLLQVYPEEMLQDPSANEADRTTFQGKTRQTRIVILADLYACQRSHMGQNMAALLPLWEAVQDVLEAQNTKSYFGLEGIKAFTWSARRAVFNYGGSEYLGARFTITVRVF